MFLGQFAVFAAYGIAAHIRGTGSLSISQTVTTLSLINLLLTPLRNLLYAIPDTFSALSCLKSIQEFLLQGKRAERRDLQPPYSESASKAGTATSGFELQQLDNRKDRYTSCLPVPALSMSNAVFGWNTRPDDDRSAETKELTLTTPHVAKGSLTIITGPVGCGKSTILKAILGETDHLHGSVTVRSPEIAYCAQDAWIVSGSVRDNITGTPDSGFDQGWYSTVIQACALDLDFAHLPQGDKTVAGSRGTKLSGGQKQRIVSIYPTPVTP
jgi:ABC-type multidrug transport system fused ATPase/permease subunit